MAKIKLFRKTPLDKVLGKIPYVKHHQAIARLENTKWLIFHTQILLAIVLFARDIAASRAILESPDIAVQLNQASIYYFRIILLGTIIPMSLLFSVGNYYGWIDDVEKELMEVFVYISWLLFIGIEMIK